MSSGKPLPGSRNPKVPMTGPKPDNPRSPRAASLCSGGRSMTPWVSKTTLSVIPILHKRLTSSRLCTKSRVQPRSAFLIFCDEDRDLVGVLIKMFEEVFGMRGYPATRIIGRDPTQTKLSGHHWPFMKVFNKPLYPRCDLAPSEA